MRWVRFGFCASVIALLVFGALGGGVAAGAEEGEEPIVVIEIADPLDQRLMDFVANAIAEGDPAHLYVLKIDSPGASSGDLATLFDAMVKARAPVVAWIGPFPAQAYGGAAYVSNHADIRSAAPGVTLGYLDPAVQRGRSGPPSTRPTDDPGAFDEVEQQLADSVVEINDETPVVEGFVDRRDPALGQLILALDGKTVVRGDVTFEISTASTVEVEGQGVVEQSRPVTFIKPGLLDRFLRLGARPETAFMFLVIGLSFAAFEFYAAGSGLMAFVASMSFILGGYGLATLPVWWPAVAMLVGGFVLLVWGFVLNRVDWRAGVGTALLLGSGLMLTTSRPAYPPSTWMVVVAVAATVLFVWYSLTTVVRGRFATPTVGRQSLIGRRCLAVATLDPIGVVSIDDVRWRATADRGVEITAGSAVEVVGITGLILEVDPVVERGREIST